MTVTGWTFEQIDATSMGDAVGLFEYWHNNPPVHVILRAVHVREPAAGGRPARQGGPLMGEFATEAVAGQGIAELMQLAGPALGAQQKMPEHLAAMADYAEEVLARMKKKHA